MRTHVTRVNSIEALSFLIIENFAIEQTRHGQTKIVDCKVISDTFDWKREADG